MGVARWGRGREGDGGKEGEGRGGMGAGLEGMRR